MHILVPEHFHLKDAAISDVANTIFRTPYQINPQTKRTYLLLWKQFSDWTATRGLHFISEVSADVVKAYAFELIQKVNAGEIGSHTAQNKVASINSMMEAVYYAVHESQWESISAKALGLRPRSDKRLSPPDTLKRNVYESRLEALRSSSRPHEIAVFQISREFGFTCTEASFFDARASWPSVQKWFPAGILCTVAAWDGKKWSRRRHAPVTTSEQYLAVQFAAQAQGKRKQLMDDGKSVNDWREIDLRAATTIMGGFHEMRAAFACERFHAIAGYQAPCAGGIAPDKTEDINHRKLLAKEMGLREYESLINHIG